MSPQTIWSMSDRCYLFTAVYTTTIYIDYFYFKPRRWKTQQSYTERTKTSAIFESVAFQVRWDTCRLHASLDWSKRRQQCKVNLGPNNYVCWELSCDPEMLTVDETDDSHVGHEDWDPNNCVSCCRNFGPDIATVINGTEIQDLPPPPALSLSLSLSVRHEINWGCWRPVDETLTLTLSRL